MASGSARRCGPAQPNSVPDPWRHRRARGASRPPGSATRPRGVRPIRPSRTRNGSATVSTVSGSSPTATASVVRPDRSAAEPRAQRREHRAVEPVEAELVHLVHLERRPRGRQAERPVAAHLRPVPHAPQQPVRDARRAPRPGRDLGGGLVRRAARRAARRTGRAPARARRSRRSRGAPVKPNRSRSGAGSRPARVVAPTTVNGGSVSGIALAPAPLPTIDVDPEVLHRHVQELLGGPREPVDLVEEEDLALLERGQDGRQVARVLDGRAARDAQRRAQLGRDDHGERRLAEPGRTGQQHVVGRPPAAAAASQHERQLVAHHALPDELLEPARAQRGLGGALEVVGRRPDQRLRGEPLGDELLASSATPAAQRPQRGAQHARDLVRGDRSLGALEHGRRPRRPPPGPFQPRPTSASTTWSRRSPPSTARRGRGHAGAGRRSGP